jgi:predicted nucleic acid-binding protein
MIVVDTTVWVDFFNGRAAPHVDELVRLIGVDEGVALTDVILTEVLQGIRADKDYREVGSRLDAFDVLRLDTLDDFRRAADIYRTARRKGLTVRRTIDCLIASVCIRESVALHHNDTDFDNLARCSDLRVHRF